MTRADRELARDALDHIATLHQHLTRGDMSDSTIADAVCLRLAAAIEAISNTSPAFRERTFADQWPIMWATRNRIAHGYAFIEMPIIKATVERDLPWFEAGLTEEVRRLSQG